MGSLLQRIIHDGGIDRLEHLLSRMKTFEQRKYMNAIVVFVVKQYLPMETANNLVSNAIMLNKQANSVKVGLVTGEVRMQLMRPSFVTSHTRPGDG